jgi:hypothetical protein
MFFTAALCHIHEDGHCCENLKSSFLVVLSRKKIPVQPKRPSHSICSTGEKDKISIAAFEVIQDKQRNIIQWTKKEMTLKKLKTEPILHKISKYRT